MSTDAEPEGASLLDAHPSPGDRALPSVEEPPLPPDARPPPRLPERDIGPDTEPPPRHALDCPQIMQCMQRCAGVDDECRRACQLRGASVAERSASLALLDCWRQSDCDAGDALVSACLRDSCAEALDDCQGQSGADDAGVPLDHDAAPDDAGPMPPDAGPVPDARVDGGADMVVESDGSAIGDMAIDMEIDAMVDVGRPDMAPLPDMGDPLPGDLDCPAAVACVLACDRDAACEADCVERTQAPLVGRTERLVACARDAGCLEADADEHCVETACEHLWRGCLQRPVPIDSCRDLHRATLWCPPNEPVCWAEHWEVASVAARGEWTRIETCITDNECRNPETGALDAVCLHQSCGALVGQCIDPLDPWPRPDRPSTCRAVAQCAPACRVGDAQCAAECESEATPDGRALFDAVVACAAEEGCGDWQDVICMNEACAESLSVCFGLGYPPDSQWTCEEYLLCLRSCLPEDEPCRSTCSRLAQRISISVFESLRACHWRERCADDVCLVDRCGAELQHCTATVRPSEQMGCRAYLECRDDCVTHECRQSCRAGTDPVGLQAADEVLACIDESGCGDDRECARLRCQAQISPCPAEALPTCVEIIGCFDECQRDAVCEDDCLQRAGEPARAQFAEIEACAQNAGCELRDAQCVEDSCQGAIDACLGRDGPPEVVAGCSAAIECFESCAYEPMGCECLQQFDDAALEAMLAVDVCRQRNCPPPLQPRTEPFATCMEEYCADSLRICGLD